MKTTFKLEGLKALDDALGGLTQSMAKGVLRRTGQQALAPFDAAWRAKAPALYHELEQSGDVGSNLSKSQRRERERESFVEVFAGPGQNPQAIAQEFGTKDNAAQPFARPAWDATKGQALDIVQTTLGDEIQKSATRLARKRAKTGKG